MDFNDSKTKECLARAFAGATQDCARFEFISKGARDEGFDFLGHILHTLSKKKLNQASVFYRVMLENLSTRKDNVDIDAGFPFESKKLATSLLDSGEIEEYEGKNVYPYFQKIAFDEGFKDIAKCFEMAGKICLKNAKKLFMLANEFDNQTLYKSTQKREFECFNCGFHEERKEGWKSCPFCNANQGFIVVNLDIT